MLMRSFNDGTISANAGEFEKALKSYRTALMIAENEQTGRAYLAKIHFNLGVCLYQQGRTARAVTELNAAINLRNGQYQKAFYVLGMAESQQNNWLSSRKAFLEAIKLNKADGEAWFDLGMVYLAQSDFGKAEKAFRNSIIYRSTDSALSHNNVGVILAMKGEFSIAEKEFEKALFLSAGRLIEAENNLKYCKARSRNLPELLAKLEFSRRFGRLRAAEVAEVRTLVRAYIHADLFAIAYARAYAI